MNNYGLILNAITIAGANLDLQDNSGSTALIYGIMIILNIIF